MTKKNIRELMKQYCIVSCELDDAIAFVADLLYMQAKELEEKEPYATRTIDSLRNASREVDSLIDYIADAEDEDIA